MTLAIMQPYLFPYTGYWQLINAVDTFVIFDDVNFIKKGYINRNSILLNGKPHIFTLELIGASQNKLINEIEIGNNVLISPHVTITSHQHSYQDADKLFREQRVLFEKVVIKDNVWIGSNAVILPGIKLGSNSIIAAGAVVIKDVPANSLVGGVPAKHIKKLFAKEDGYNELTHKRDV